MTQLVNGRVTITPHYGVKVNRGNFSSEDLGHYLSIEFDIAEDADAAGVVAEAIAMSQTITESILKPAVLDGLGLDATALGNGNIVADLSQAGDAGSTSAAPTYSGGGGGGQQRQSTPPKATPEQTAALPRFVADLDGTPAEWVDQRTLKDSGIYSPNAADFKRADGKKQVWLYDKQGNMKSSVVESLAAAGITV